MGVSLSVPRRIALALLAVLAFATMPVSAREKRTLHQRRRRCLDWLGRSRPLRLA